MALTVFEYGYWIYTGSTKMNVYSSCKLTEKTKKVYKKTMTSKKWSALISWPGSCRKVLSFSNKYMCYIMSMILLDCTSVLIYLYLSIPIYLTSNL
jgi:hypothetical protein